MPPIIPLNKLSQENRFSRFKNTPFGIQRHSGVHWNRCNKRKYSLTSKLFWRLPYKNLHEHLWRWKLLMGTTSQQSFIICSRKFDIRVFTRFRPPNKAEELKAGGSFWCRWKAHIRFLNTCPLKIRALVTVPFREPHHRNARAWTWSMGSHLPTTPGDYHRQQSPIVY